MPCGVSLGGNALLKWLGEQNAAAQSVIAAAAAVSAPLDLMAAGNALDAGFNLVYTHNFLRTLKRKSAGEAAALSRPVRPRPRCSHARTLREFDDVVTAPLHGFRDTDDYWTRASSKPWLRRYRSADAGASTRATIRSCRRRRCRSTQEVSAAVQLEQPQDGGHVGFVGGAFPGHLDWLPQRLLAYFSGPLNARMR